MAVSERTAVMDRGEVSSSIETPPITRQRTSRKISLIGVLLLTAAVYSLPWIPPSRSPRAGLPPVFGADFYAYLNLSHTCTLMGISDRDPWYGVPIQPKFGHSIFRAAFVLFGAGRSLLGSDMAASVAWSICWSVLIALSLWLLLRTLFEGGSSLFLFAGTCMMVFFSLTTLKINIIDWVHFLSGGVGNEIPLPFIRMFFPQLVIPLLALYFLSCKEAWDRGRTRDYVLLVLIQIATFVSFPYGSVFAGLATFFFLLLIAKRNDLGRRVAQFAMVGVVSLLADGLYLWLAHLHVRSVPTAQHGPSMFHLDLGQLCIDFGGTVVLLFALSVFLLFLRQNDSSRLMVVSIALANVVMLLADCLIDPRLLVSHHAGYFVQISLGLELCAVVFWAKSLVSRRLFTVAAATASLFFVLNGALASWTAVRNSSEMNTRLGSFAAVMSRLNLSSNDLVIAPAKEVDDVSTTVPLLTRAHVLYTPEAEILLGPGDESVVGEHQAIYLFLSGRDSTWVEAQLSRHLLPSAIMTPGQRFDLQYHHRPDLMEKEVREALVPKLLALDDRLIPPVFTASHRVVILDDIDHPTFIDSHVKRLLTVSEDYKIGSIRVRICSAADGRV